MGREVPRRAIGGLDPDLARPLQLRRVRVPGPLALPVVEDAGRVLPLLRRFAPVARRQAAVLLPRATGQPQTPLPVARDPQPAHGRGPAAAALRPAGLPPH